MTRRIWMGVLVVLLLLVAIPIARASLGGDILGTKLVLQDLQIEGLELGQAFHSKRIQYGVAVKGSVDEIKVRPVAAHQDVQMTVNGTLNSGVAQSIKLEEGMNVVRVTLSSGNLARQYTVLVTKEGK